MALGKALRVGCQTATILNAIVGNAELTTIFFVAALLVALLEND